MTSAVTALLVLLGSTVTLRLMNVQSTLVNMVELVQILLTDLDVVVLWDLEDLHAGKIRDSS